MSRTDIGRIEQREGEKNGYARLILCKEKETKKIEEREQY